LFLSEKKKIKKYFGEDSLVTKYLLDLINKKMLEVPVVTDLNPMGTKFDSSAEIMSYITH
jgi:hypothetical protein